MALDQLLGPKIQLTLNISEGHGFGFLTCPILISASLKGHEIETDIVEPSPNPFFGTQLVWETDKKKIKRLRYENTVLKIDCKQIVDKRTERIGYIFINLKQAQIVPQGKQPTDMWFRLLGICKEARALSPEISLSLAIEDIPESLSTTVTQCPPPLTDGSHQPAKPTKSSTVGFTVMPVYHEGEGIIQLGPDTPLSEVFLFTIQILSVNNLNMLIPEGTEVKEGPYIVFSLMGHSVNSQSLSGYEQGSNKVNSSVVIRVRSTILMLSAYFKQSPDAQLKLMVNDDKVLGSSSLHLQKLVPSEDFVTICSKFGKHNSRYIETRCNILQDNEEDLAPTAERAYIDVIVRLSYETNQRKNKQKSCELPDSRESHPITPASKCEGDEESRTEDVANEPVTPPPQESPRLSQFDSEPNSPVPNEACKENKDTEPLISYVLTVTINSIVVNKLPDSGTLEFRFLHSGTDITNPTKQKFVISAVNEKINLPFAEAQLYFSSPAGLVDDFLQSQPVKITLYDKTVIFASTSLNLLKAQKEDCICLPLESNKHKKGFVYVSVMVKERQCQSSLSTTDSHQSSSVQTQCDEEILEKVVSELEDWKEKQQHIFLKELEDKEKQHLAKVEENYLASKKAAEKNVLEQVESNKKMSESLSVALSNLKLREKEIEEKEIELKNKKDTLEGRYNMKYQELREASKHMQEDLSYKFQQITEEKNKLEKHIVTLENDKIKLLKMVEGLQMRLKSDKTEKLAKDVQGLLKEMERLKSQLDTEIQSKNFFKEQWGKAVRELHILREKYETAYNMERLRQTEESRNNLLYQVLCDEEQAMKQDQIKLKQLRSELLTQRKSQDNFATPIVLTRAKSCNGPFAELSSVIDNETVPVTGSDTSQWKQKDMVEKLVQQRNEMLLAGDSLYDSHIQRLNQQISFLNSLLQSSQS